MSAIVSSNYTTQHTALEGILRENQYLIGMGIVCLMFGVVSFLGLIGNTINIVTYISMRPNDVITVSFLVLAFSEFSYLATMAICAVAFGFYFTEKIIYNMTIWFPVDPYGVHTLVGNIGLIPYTFAILITTLLAVARCVSVWKPLEFKNIFRMKRFIYILTVFLLFSVGTYVPVLVYMGLIDQFNAEINASRPSLWISPKREQIKIIMWTIRDAILPIATQIIVFGCVIVMARSLKKTSAFRQSQLRKTIAKKTTTENSESAKKLTGKELHAVQQVFFIAMVFIVCNIPKIIVSFLPYYLPDFALGHLNQRMYLICVGLEFFFQAINSSTSFLIYYRYSTKFRKHFALCFTLR